jgi:hypothetical protein
VEVAPESDETLTSLLSAEDSFNPRTRSAWGSIFLRSAASAILNRRDFADVERYCFFVGYARSGHSVVATLLNAHPEMVISNELHALRFVQHGFRRNQVFALIVARDHAFEASGRQWTGYDYSVPNQSQGMFTQLRVIGDKKGGASTRYMAEHPGLLDRLRRVMGVPIRVIHVTRNPFDNIARMTMNSRFDLRNTIARYGRLCDSVSTIRRQLAGDELLDMRHEEFFSSPSDTLASMCKFLGLDADPEYLAACSSIVQPPSRRARDGLDWTNDDIDLINRIIASHPVLEGYSFES